MRYRLSIRNILKKFLKKFLTRIILALNGIAVVLLLLSYLSTLISPDKVWIFAFFGLAYLYILVANLIFIIYWITIRKRYFLISLLAILLGWGQMRKFVQIRVINEKKHDSVESFKILSYNVRLFNYFKWLGDTAINNNIFDFISYKKPEIICFQEFLTNEGGGFKKKDIVEKLKGTLNLQINYFHIVTNIKNSGIATISRFPIINKGYLKFRNSINNAIYSDIIIHSDTLRVYNCHLQSIHLKKRNYDFIDSLILQYNNKHLDEIKDISFRLRDAYIKRARQVDILSAHIENSPYPVIVCGDFNDTPVSYTYRKMKGKLADAYLKSGSGIGNTYLGNFPSFRIDYILYSKKLKSLNFETMKIKWSDHYPVSCDMIIK